MRIIHGKIPIDVDGESAGEKIERCAAFTNQFFDAMNAAVMGGRASSMAFIHENGFILAITEGNENPSQDVATPPCPYCGVSCKKKEVYDDLAELAEELQEDNTLNDKQRRFQLYQLANRLLPEGARGKGNRKRLPECIEVDIHDFFPRGANESYVGFREVE